MRQLKKKKTQQFVSKTVSLQDESFKQDANLQFCNCLWFVGFQQTTLLYHEPQESLFLILVWAVLTFPAHLQSLPLSRLPLNRFLSMPACPLEASPDENTQLHCRNKLFTLYVQL